MRPDPVPGCGRRSPRWRYRSWGWQPVPRARVVQRAGDRNRRPGPTSTRGSCVHPHRVDRRHHAWAGSAAMSSSARACPIVAVVARSSLRRGRLHVRHASCSSSHARSVVDWPYASSRRHPADRHPRREGAGDHDRGRSPPRSRRPPHRGRQPPGTAFGRRSTTPADAPGGRLRRVLLADR